jgi:hypothetical protein
MHAAPVRADSHWGKVDDARPCDGAAGGRARHDGSVGDPKTLLPIGFEALYYDRHGASVRSWLSMPFSSDAADSWLYVICLRRIVEVCKVIAVTGIAPKEVDVLACCTLFDMPSTGLVARL